MVGLDAFTDGVLQLVESVVLADVLGKVVVQLGQLLVLDLMQLDLEDGVLAGQLLSLVLLGNLTLTSNSSPALWPTTCSSKPGMKEPEPSTRE